MGLGMVNGDISKEQAEHHIHHNMRMIGLVKFAWLMKGWDEEEIDSIIEKYANEAQEIAKGDPVNALKAIADGLAETIVEESEVNAERED